MLILNKDEHKRAAGFVEEFARHSAADGVLPFDCIYRSHDFPDTRVVVKIKGPRNLFALKIDTDSPNSGRLKKEFNLLTHLTKALEKNKTSHVIRPRYMSPQGMFFVTELVERPTCADVIHNSPDNDQVSQIYRRAGAWLHDLHNVQPPKDYGFRPRWMTDSICALLTEVPTHIRNEGQAMADRLERDGLLLKGIPETQVFSHGDFHGQNLLVGQGEMIGLDFTESRSKLAVYDIVDFLKSDIFRNADPSDIDQSGIVKHNKDMFFRRYRHPIHMEILDFCIRGRLLKDWLSLWQPTHTCSNYEESRRQRLGDRLRIAFQSG